MIERNNLNLFDLTRRSAHEWSFFALARHLSGRPAASKRNSHHTSKEKILLPPT